MTPEDNESGAAADEGAKNLLSGLLFVAFGVGALVMSARYPIGTAVRMGPGYLPQIVAWGLVALGIAAILRGVLVGGWRMPSVALRPLLLIAAAVIAFALTIDRLGLFVASLASVVIAAASDATSNWRQAIVIALGLAIFCSVLFGWALGLSVPVWPR